MLSVYSLSIIIGYEKSKQKSSNLMYNNLSFFVTTKDSII